MPEDLQKAIDILNQTGSTCVLCRENLIHQTTARGVQPLLDWLDSGEDTWACSAADKVVGKAAAHLYCLLGVRRVHGNVVSLAAMRLLRRNGVEVYWDKLADSIRNRAGTGTCPLEEATLDIDEPDDALPVIRATLARLQSR